jgi:hypothetical protein
VTPSGGFTGLGGNPAWRSAAPQEQDVLAVLARADAGSRELDGLVYCCLRLCCHPPVTLMRRPTGANVAATDHLVTKTEMSVARQPKRLDRHAQQERRGQSGPFGRELFHRHRAKPCADNASRDRESAPEP